MATYRRAIPAEAPAIVAFQIAMARETEGVELDEGICTQGVQAVFDNPLLGQYFVCEKDGDIVASTLITYEWSDWRNGLVWWIQSVYVVPDARRQGIYSGLYEQIRTLANAETNVCGIRLYVDKRNTTAQRVYSQLGMNGEHYQVFEWMKI